MSTSIICLLFSGILDANATRLAMEPKNRVLLGGSWIDGGLGASVGIESRLTQLVYVNVGGFANFSENIGDIDSQNQQDWVTMQHAIWAAPGTQPSFIWTTIGFCQYT